MREVDEVQRGMVGVLEELCGVGDPARGDDVAARPPEVEEREGAELLLEGVAEGGGAGVNVGEFASVCWVAGAGGYGVVGRGVHVVPPEGVCDCEFGVAETGFVPDLWGLD